MFIYPDGVMFDQHIVTLAEFEARLVEEIEKAEMLANNTGTPWKRRALLAISADVPVEAIPPVIELLHRNGFTELFYLAEAGAGPAIPPLPVPGVRDEVDALATTISAEEYNLPLLEARRRLIDRRHQLRPTAITSNIKLSAWGKYLGDATVTAAILDRLAMTAVRLDIDGPSYRQHLARLRAGEPAAGQFVAQSRRKSFDKIPKLGGLEARDEQRAHRLQILRLPIRCHVHAQPITRSRSGAHRRSSAANTSVPAHDRRDRLLSQPGERE